MIVANWKMNLTMPQVLSLCTSWQNHIQDTSSKLTKLIIAPPMPYLSLVNHLYPNLTFAAQDVSSLAQDQGSYTGEVSSYILASMKIRYAIVGHYERRKYFSENNETIILKAKNCLKHNIIPIICFGEENIHDDPIAALEQLAPNFSQDTVYYAYEPYWAIGQKNADMQIARTNINKVIKYLAQQNHIKKMLYGGSVNSNTINELNNIEGLDGLLVGSASLKLEELINITKL